MNGVPSFQYHEFGSKCKLVRSPQYKWKLCFVGPFFNMTTLILLQELVCTLLLKRSFLIMVRLAVIENTKTSPRINIKSCQVGHFFCCRENFNSCIYSHDKCSSMSNWVGCQPIHDPRNISPPCQYQILVWCVPIFQTFQFQGPINFNPSQSRMMECICFLN